MTTFRPLAEADAEAFAALNLEGIRAFPEAFLLTEEEALATPIERVAARLASGWMHGIFEEDALVGFAGLEFRPWAMAKHRAHIGPVYVTPKLHGTGLAHRLMMYLTDLARSRGVSQLELWVAVDNHRARALYADAGFVAKGRMPAAVMHKDGPRDDLFMVCDLSEPAPERGPDGLRRLGPGDWRAFRDIRLDMLKTAPHAFGSLHSEWEAKPADAVADWLRMIRLFAVMEDGVALATLGWHVMPGAVQAHRGHVIAAFTRHTARRHGYFAKLMDAVAADARDQEMIQLELDVGAENAAARAAYEAHGFTVTGGIPRALNHDGQISNQLYMVRPL